MTRATPRQFAICFVISFAFFFVPGAKCQTLIDALDNPTLVWATDSWRAQSTNASYTVDNVDSAASAPDRDGWIELILPEPGYLTFWWRNEWAGGGWDTECFVDGAFAARSSGSWQSMVIRIEPGTRPDGSTAVRWIGPSGRIHLLDQVSFTPDQDKLPNPSVSLGESVDSTNLVWAADGFTGQHTNTVDSEDAVVSIPTRHCWISTVLPGPGYLSFYWKSSWSFELLVDGQSVASAPPDWSRTVLRVERGAALNGNILVRWQSYDGLALLDQVEFTPDPLPAAPSILRAPSDQLIVQGETLGLSLDFLTAGPYTVQWFCNGVLQSIENVTNGPFEPRLSVFTITNAQKSNAGLWSAVVSNAAAAVIAGPATVQVIPTIPLVGALDVQDARISALVTQPLRGWFGQRAVSTDGDAAQSGMIGDYDTTAMTLTVSEAGTLSFWWKVSSEADYDTLAVFVATNVSEGATPEFTRVAHISGNVAWTQCSLQLPTGQHLVRWEYTKDSSLSYGKDCGWVDRLSFSPAPQTPLLAMQPKKVGTEFSMTAIADPKRAYWVEYTTNLRGGDWRFLTGVTNTNGLIRFRDAGASDTMRFYRVVSALAE